MFKPRSLAFVVVVLVGSGGAARAQGVVPGGWAGVAGYQSFGAGSPVAGGMVFGFGAPGFGGGYGPYGYGGGYPYVQRGIRTNSAVSPFGVSPMPQVVNGMDPLVNAIRRSTRTRRTR